MPVLVVDEKCRVENGRLVIVIEGGDPAEVVSMQAKNAALRKAAELGYPKIGLNNQSGSYPVDKDGRTEDEHGREYDWNQLSKEGKIAAYRNDIVLMEGL